MRTLGKTSTHKRLSLATKENTINCRGKCKSLAIPLEELSERDRRPAKNESGAALAAPLLHESNRKLVLGDEGRRSLEFFAARVGVERLIIAPANLA